MFLPVSLIMCVWVNVRRTVLTAVLQVCSLVWKWRSWRWWTAALWLPPPRRAWRERCGCPDHREPPRLTSTLCPSEAPAPWSPPGRSSSPLQSSRRRLQGNTMIHWCTGCKPIQWWKHQLTAGVNINTGVEIWAPGQFWLAGFAEWRLLARRVIFFPIWFIFKLTFKCNIFLCSSFIYQKILMVWTHETFQHALHYKSQWIKIFKAALLKLLFNFFFVFRLYGRHSTLSLKWICIYIYTINSLGSRFCPKPCTH